MKKVYFLICFLLIISCNSVEKEDLTNINGYWEIHKVIQPDGNKVDFNMNTIYDYYELGEDYKGIYKKAIPQLDGTFVVDEYQEEIEIIENNNSFEIKFYSEFSDDRELSIIEITTNKLILKNQEDKTYYYKRTKPINLLDNEQ